jgi:tetratricopeptide (TPR) repeat protein
MKRSSLLLCAALFAGLYLPAAWAQSTGTVKGACKDVNGKPITGATVEWANIETGRKYALKTNNKGEYFSLGIEAGKYKVTLSKDGQEIFHVNGAMVSLDETTQDFDMQKEQANAAAGAGMTPEQLKKQQEEAEKVSKENNTIKALNEKLAAAKTASDAGDFDTAIAQLTEATQMDPKRDLIWFKLGDAYRNSAVKQTDSGEKSKRLTEAAGDYEKAVEIKQQDFDAAAVKKPDDVKQLAAYYNNLGDAESKAGKADDAVKAYTQAVTINPEGAAGYYYNIGAVLTNTGRLDDAIAAFDKSIAADPNRADAYYQKGVNLVGKAKTDSSGKVVPAPGTAEAFNKYLQLQPTGQYAETAKSMLQYIGSTVETTFGKQKTKK